MKTAWGSKFETSHIKIVKRYLTGWFIIDLLSILPFDTLGMVFDSDEIAKLKLVKVVRLLRLLKLMRVLRGSRLFKRIEVRVAINYAKLALFRYGLLMVVT